MSHSYPMTDSQATYVAALTHQHTGLIATLNLTAPVTSREASNWIETVKVECLNRYGWRAGSRNAIIADHIARGWSDESLMGLLGKTFGYGHIQRDIVFSNNVRGGKRVPKSTAEQMTEMAKTADSIRKDLARRGNTPVVQEPPVEEPVPDAPVDADEFPDADADDDDIALDATPENALHPFLAKIREIRAEETRRANVEGKRTPILEAVSGNRPAVNGAKALKVGIPTEALLHSLALDWPSEARNRYSIRDYDVTSFNGEAPAGRHAAYPYVRRMVDARIPTALIGPSGTGKSTLVKQIAEDMNLDYGMIPCNAGVTPSWFLGAYVLDPSNPYRSRSAMDMFVNGGVLVLEEFDSIDPNIALIANNLIENDVFENPITGDKLQRDPDFVVICCMNTLGLGQTSTNTGRTRLDDATRNRFAIGRVMLTLDENLESEIFDSILNG